MPLCCEKHPHHYHGFVLDMVVNLSDSYKVHSKSESGKNDSCSFGRYDVMIEPLDKTGKAFILEFKVLDPDEDEKMLEDTLANAGFKLKKNNMKLSLYPPAFCQVRFVSMDLHLEGKNV